MTRSEEIRAAQRAGNGDETQLAKEEFLGVLKLALGLADDGLCPHCKQPMKQKQVRRCVFADPCGHRLYQGKANKKK